jgi:hypothetical protein
MDTPRNFTFGIIKTVSGEQRTVAGILTAELPDKDGETLDYEGSKPYFLEWSEEIKKATEHLGPGGESYGNVREQHSKRCVGKLICITFDDEKKQIYGVAKITMDDAWQNCKDGVYNAFSIGGELVSVRRQGKLKLFIIKPREVSIVDNPALGATHFDYVKDASTTIHKAFLSQPALTPEEAIATIEKVLAQLKENTPSVEKAARYLVTEDDGTTHLPVTSEDGKPDHNLMGAAWAALHDGYRGNKYEGPDKDAAIAKLKRLYESEGMKTPDEKEASADSEKQLSNPSVGVTPMPMTIEKAAMKSLHDRIDAMKAAHTAHKEACIKAAEDHCKDMHAHCDAIKAHLGGATNGEEGDGEKSASSEISKALAALTEKVNALTTEKAATEKATAEKAAADKLAADKAAEEKATAEKAAADKLAAERIGDRSKTDEASGQSTVEKAAAAKKEREYNADLSKRAMGGNGVAGDRDALFELYDRTVKITPKKIAVTV